MTQWFLGRFTIAVLCSLAALPLQPLPATAQDRPWSLQRDFTSPIDGKRTLLVSAQRGEITIVVGCDLRGPLATIDLGRAILPARPRLPGKYRIDQLAPVEVTWDASASQTASLMQDEARSLVATLWGASIWHIRIGDVERSIDPRGLGEFSQRLREACAIAPPSRPGM